ncbi:MAG TPA: nuclear transport factor 2 family protein [Xanthomonadales bacterium]|nr:nuclear transport factor 2 family protein [Xanthomonadales bacterium]
MMHSIKTLLLSLGIVLFLSAPAMSAEQTVEEEVLKHVVAFNGAYERNELDAYFAFYAEDATLWFGAGRTRLADYKKDWYQLIEKGGGVEKNILSDLHVQMGPGNTTAVATYQVDVETRMPDGSVTKDHAHETDVWFLGDDQWLIAHIHYTVDKPE